MVVRHVLKRLRTCEDLRTERAMVRWMCGVTLKDSKSSQVLLDRLGVEDIVDVVKRGRLLWFAHVERKTMEDWVKMCRDLVVVGVQTVVDVRKRGRNVYMRKK
jgi:hypothetical protein